MPGGVFRAQAVTAGVYRDLVEFGVFQSGYDIQVQRFTQRAGFFGSVQNGDFSLQKRGWQKAGVLPRKDGTILLFTKPVFSPFAFK